MPRYVVRINITQLILWSLHLCFLIYVQEHYASDLVYCSNNANCLPFSYCTTLKINSKIDYCRWGNGEPYICCPKNYSVSVCGVLSLDVQDTGSEQSFLEAAAIVGGFPVRTAKASPWMVALGEEIKPREYEWFCGASLVSKNRVLTAAHCVERRKIDIIKVGELDLDSSDDNASPYEVSLSESILHPQYKTPSFYYDIAILKLKEDIIFSNYVKPICFLPPNCNDTYEGAIATLTGWGRISFGGKRSSILQEVNVSVINNSNCSLLYKRPDVRHFHYPNGIISSQLCASHPDGGRDACQGDSGGPLVLTISGVHYLIGIISSGFGCGSKTFPGVYTRVSFFSDWIKEHM